MNYTSTVLQAKNISVQFTTEKGCVQAVKDISIEVHKGKITALIGQSGSGKSATAMAIAGILDSNGTMTSGQIYLQNQDINKLKGKSLRTYRGETSWYDISRTHGITQSFIENWGNKFIKH